MVTTKKYCLKTNFSYTGKIIRLHQINRAKFDYFDEHIAYYYNLNILIVRFNYPFILPLKLWYMLLSFVTPAAFALWQRPPNLFPKILFWDESFKPDLFDGDLPSNKEPVQVIVDGMYMEVWCPLLENQRRRGFGTSYVEQKLPETIAHFR